MSVIDASWVDLVGGLLSLILTLGVFSYVLGDNFLFRLALHIFIGVTTGFVLVIVSYNVIWSQLISPMFFSDSMNKATLIVPLLLAALLLFKASPRLAGLGNPVLAFLVGVGAAVAIGGSIMGTIFPQVSATISFLDIDFQENYFIFKLINGTIILVGTLSTLIFFHFNVSRNSTENFGRPVWLTSISWVGQVFIAIVFGVLFAGVYAASITAFVERWIFIYQFFNQIFTLII
jgi:hypothetical protein